MRSCVLAFAFALAFLGATDPADAKRKKRKPKPPPESMKVAGTVRLVSTTAGALIYIDEQEIGQVPMNLPLSLRPGNHKVKLTKPGYADYIDTFDLKPGQDLTLEIDLLATVGALRVDGTPMGALVFLDGIHVGEVPFAAEAEPGLRKVEVRAQGYTTQTESLNVEAGNSYRVEVQLVAMLPMPADDGPTPWYGHWWVWAAGAAVVAGGITAAILLTEGAQDGGPEPDGVVEIETLFE